MTEGINLRCARSGGLWDFVADEAADESVAAGIVERHEKKGFWIGSSHSLSLKHASPYTKQVPLSLVKQVASP
jgi:hypothetical protein